MRADFHMHTYYSRDCATSPEALVARALRMGIGCIAVTDHNTIRGGQAVAKIAPFPVIVASEVKSTHGEITGLFLTEEVLRGLSPMETVERIKAQGGLVSIPHPYDTVRTSVLSDDAMVEVLPHADIIEAFNARNVFRGAEERARAAAAEHGLAVTAVSDSHHPWEMGCTYTEMPEFDGTPQGSSPRSERRRCIQARRRGGHSPSYTACRPTTRLPTACTSSRARGSNLRE